MDIILKYFSDFTDEQLAQFEQLAPLYKDWNSKINVISRKDIDNLYERHILHALALEKVMPFADGTRVLDLGTGGGIPGIPLAIANPDVHFTLIDGTRKKITVVQDIVEQLGLKNVVAKQQRAEESKEKFDFVVTRAVASLDKLLLWSRRLLTDDHKNIFPNGIFAYKGGDIDAEIKSIGRHEYAEHYPITDFFDVAYYAEKGIVYVQG